MSSGWGAEDQLFLYPVALLLVLLTDVSLFCSLLSLLFLLLFSSPLATDFSVTSIPSERTADANNPLKTKNCTLALT
jgi:hypothetical protein